MAALVVVVGHGLIAFDFALYSGNPADSVTRWDIWLSGAPFQLPIAGNYAVCLFFVISGFVLTGVFDAARLNTVALLAKRYVRLAIPMTAACILSYIALKGGWVANHPVAAITRSSWLAAHFHQPAAFLAAVREGAWGGLFDSPGMMASYDSSLWTMPVEFAGSVGALLLCLVAKSLQPSAGRRRMTYALLALPLYAVFACSYLGLFAAGALLRQMRPDGVPYLNRHPALPLAACIAGVFLGTVPVSLAAWPMFSILPAVQSPAWLPWPASSSFYWHTVGAILAFAGLQSCPPMQDALRSRACQWLGAISFPLYLIHIPILMTVGCQVFLVANAMGVPRIAAVAVAIPASTVASLLGAHVLTLTVERFALRFSAQVGQWLQSGIGSLGRRPA